MNIVLKLESLLLKFERVIMLVVGLFLPTIITVGVIFRYILNTDLYAIEEIEVFLAIWFYFIGSAYASYKKSQITADLLQATIKSYTIRKYIAVIAAVFTVLIGIAFCYWSFDMINYAWVKKPQTAVWKLPLIGEYAGVSLSLILMTIYAVRDLVTAIRRTPESETPISGQAE